MLTQERARKLLDYDPETGVLTWKENRNQHVRAGDIAGSEQVMHQGKYICIRVHVDGKLYIASRVIWLWMTGASPKNDIDHRDQCSTNNRWGNLRDTDRNAANHPRRIDNRSGCTGVGWFKVQRKWRARINVNGKSILIGYFDKRKDAVIARRRANAEYGFSPLHGRG